jgi:hypothetical protein
MKSRLSTRLTLALVLLLLAGAPLFAQQPAPPVLRLPGVPDKALDPASLLGRNERDVRLEDAAGNTIVYHGLSLLEVLEKGGLDLKTMAGQRASAAQVVLASGRDGYTVVFSVGELTANRSNPKVFLVAESSGEGPLPEKEGPVRLIVYGDKARSAYGLAKIELKTLAENKPAK